MLATLPDPTRTTTPPDHPLPPEPSSPPPSPSAVPPGALVARAATGDDRAFAALVRRHESMLRTVVGRILDGTAEVDDVVQETFLTAWLRMADLVEGDAIAGWLATTARRRSDDRSVLPIVAVAPSCRRTRSHGPTTARTPSPSARRWCRWPNGSSAPCRTSSDAAGSCDTSGACPTGRSPTRSACPSPPSAGRSPGRARDPQRAAGLALTARPVDRRTGGTVPAGPVPPVRRVVTVRATRPRSRSGRRAGRRSTCGPLRSSGPRRAPSAPPGR